MPNPTVTPSESFCAETDAKVLKTAMKGLGTDEKAIIEVTGNRNNAQRLEIAEAFKSIYGKDLIKELCSELSGNLKNLVKSCYQSPIEYDAETINWAIKGAGTNEQMLNLLIVSRSPSQLDELKTFYQKKYNRSIEADISNDTSGDYKKILLQLLKGGRDQSEDVDQDMAQADANELYTNGVARWGTNEDLFNKIFSQRNFAQLSLTFSEYAKMTGHSIDEAISKEMSGNVKSIYKDLIDYALNSVTFYAHQLKNSMKGLGTNDHLLVYLIVSRSEIDLEDISEAYLFLYRSPLVKDVKGDTSGDYKKLLLMLLGNN